MGPAERERGAPRSMSGCKALQGVAEGCFGGCWYPGIKNSRTDVLGALWRVGEGFAGDRWVGGPQRLLIDVIMIEDFPLDTIPQPLTENYGFPV